MGFEVLIGRVFGSEYNTNEGLRFHFLVALIHKFHTTELAGNLKERKKITNNSMCDKEDIINMIY